MKISELVKRLEKIKDDIGDVDVCTTGFYATLEVEEIKVTTWGEEGWYLDEGYNNPDPTKLVVFLPGNFP